MLPDPSPNPNIHTYLACDSNGGGRSTLDGTVMRTNMMDDGHTAVQWDYALASADSSCARTNHPIAKRFSGGIQPSCRVLRDNVLARCKPHDHSVSPCVPVSI